MIFKQKISILRMIRINMILSKKFSFLLVFGMLNNSTKRV